jgi:DinB superfamily
MNRWFDRKFELDLPLTTYRDVLKRLREVPDRLEGLLFNLPTSVLTGKTEGKWSMQEIAGHLLDLEPLGMGRLDDFEAGRPDLRVADLQNRKTFEANHNSTPIRALLSEFRKERNAFVDRLQNYGPEFIQQSAVHPRLKIPMRVIDFAFFVAEHDDHHLATIKEMKDYHQSV